MAVGTQFISVACSDSTNYCAVTFYNRQSFTLNRKMKPAAHGQWRSAGLSRSAWHSFWFGLICQYVSACKIIRLYVQRLQFATPWLTDRHCSNRLHVQLIARWARNTHIKVNTLKTRTGISSVCPTCHPKCRSVFPLNTNLHFSIGTTGALLANSSVAQKHPVLIWPPTQIHILYP